MKGKEGGMGTNKKQGRGKKGEGDSGEGKTGKEEGKEGLFFPGKEEMDVETT